MRRASVIVSVAVVAALLGAPAGADDPPQMRDATDGVVDTPIELHELHEAQHGPSTDHIPGSSENVELVGQLTVHDASEGRISDVWSQGHYAYLGTYVLPNCDNTGIYVVDISDPTDPQEVGFISQAGHVDDAEGSRPQDLKVIHMRTKHFKGDVLIHSNEPCNALSQPGPGGVTLWDVTDPLNPEFLGHGGDFDLADFFFGHANGVHNVYPWQDGDRAYAALVDDWELLDLDILDITDPRNPVLIAETGLPDWPDATVDGNGGTSFNHDVWVQRIGGRQILVSSYWDTGFVLLDVTDPANPVFLGDSDYPDPDPLTGFSPAEGNAHAAVFSPSGRFILAGDEDFSPARLEFHITSGPNAGPYDAGEFGFTKPVSTFPGEEVNGPTVYGGSACPGADLDGNGIDDRDDVPDASILSPEPGEETVLVTTRGTCFFSDKIHSGELKGYDVVIVGNHHVGAAGGAAPDAAICGGQGSPVDGTAAGLCIGHRAMHLLFNDPVEFEPVTGATSPDMPPAGTLGERIRAASVFDGWGYLHLIDTETLEEVDAFAPPEVLDPAFATGFGDLTMHNVETQGNIAAISWYSLGLRVVRFGEQGLREVGHYIDENGNNFWGVHIARGHRNTILASDRDTGLWIFKFKGDRRP